MTGNLTWGHKSLQLEFAWGADRPVQVVTVQAGGKRVDVSSGLPVVEVLVPGWGRTSASDRLVHTKFGQELRYASHDEGSQEFAKFLNLTLVHERAGVEVTVHLVSPEGGSTFKAHTTVRNLGITPFTMRSVTSWIMPFGTTQQGLSDEDKFERWQVSYAHSDWLAESRWTTEELRGPRFPNIIERPGDHNPRGCFSAVSTGTWSTGKYLPVSAVTSVKDELTWAWQIEHNGAWRWEVGEDIQGGYFALSGPTDADHQWFVTLDSGESFESVPVAVALACDFEDAVAELTQYRRTARREHVDNTRMPVIFNDYMNTLMGDPTTDRLLPLIDAAAEAGIETFCVDCGWYDETGDWWDSVGEWIPSRTRFPNGLNEVIDHIRDRGMIPGLWLEPEVIGVRSAIAKVLPDGAFLLRGGKRIVEHERFHLDFRHPAAVEHMNGVIDRLVNEFGVGYFKFDYNINPGAGTDHDSQNAGDGLLGHNRAYLAWIDSVLDRHPELVLENCGSGAMRMDFAMLSRMQLQSTSDQRDFRNYVPIAASAPATILPEQAGNWAYPEADMSLEEVAFCLSNSMLGRFFLSGYLNKMSPDRMALIKEAVQANKDIRSSIQTGLPFWPLGLPQWTDQWVVLGLADSQGALLTVWNRAEESAQITLSLPQYIGSDLDVECIFPKALTEWSYTWNKSTGHLHIDKPISTVSARTFRLTLSRTSN